MGVSKNRGTPNGWVRMENPIKMDDLGVPLFSETSLWRTQVLQCWEYWRISRAHVCTPLCHWVEALILVESGSRGSMGFLPPPKKKKRHRVKGNDFWSDFLQRVLEILVSQNLERFCWKEPAFQPLKVMVPWAVSTVSTFSRDELGKVYPRSIWDAYDVSRCLKMYLRCLRCSLIKATCIGPIEQSLQISYQGFIVS